MHVPKSKAVILETLVRWLLTLLSLWAAYRFYLGGDSVSLASALLCAGLLQLARPVELLLGIKLPSSWRWVYLTFIFASMYLGEIHSFFYLFLWWDDMLHTCSAIMITYVALLLFRLLHGQDLKASGINPNLPVARVFCFTLAFSVLWELLEFSADQLLGVNMLKGRDSTIPGSVYEYKRALVNTMQDLAEGALGACLVAMGTWFHLRYRGRFSQIFGFLIKDYLECNKIPDKHI